MNIKQSIIDDLIIKMIDKRANKYLRSPNLLERLLEDEHISETEYDLFIEWVEWLTDKDHYHNNYLAEKVAKKEYNLHDIIDNGISPNEFF